LLASITDSNKKYNFWYRREEISTCGPFYQRWGQGRLAAGARDAAAGAAGAGELGWIAVRGKRKEQNLQKDP
jgi:hypothetical protein